MPTLQVVLTDDLVGEVDRLRGGLSRSGWLRQVVVQAVEGGLAPRLVSEGSRSPEVKVRSTVDVREGLVFEEEARPPDPGRGWGEVGREFGSPAAYRAHLQRMEKKGRR